MNPRPSAAADGSSAPPRRLLIRGVNWLGDAVMTTPALERLREALPQTRIVLLTHEKLGPLWQEHPGLDEVMTFAAGESVWSVAGRLRAAEFDAALILPNSPRSALEAWLARVPRRIGLARPGRNWLLSERVAIRSGHVAMRRPSRREIRRIVAAGQNGTSGAQSARPSAVAHQSLDYLHLAAALGANPAPLPPRLVVAADEIERAALKFQLRSVAAEPPLLLALNAGAEYGPAKRWPVARFIDAARQIQERTRCIWLILGGEGDVGLAGEIHAALGSSGAVRNLAGQTSLRELMVLLSRCRVLLTNDSGPMHVAAALGTPVVVPFGSTSPELTGPGLPGDPRHRLLTGGAPCAPCFRRTCPIDLRCLTGIGVAPIVAAVVELSASGQARAACVPGADKG